MLLELLVIGAGPHCLTTLMRLLEPEPDPHVDDRRRRPTSKAALERRMHRQRCDKQCRAAHKAWLAAHVAVVDASGEWLGRWRSQFDALSISHLRSTSALHVEPHDGYALTTYAAAAGREGEVRPLRHISKGEHFYGPFHTPSAALFEDQSRDCIHRYCLDSIVVKAQVTHLLPVRDAASGAITHHVATLDDGTTLTARRVLLGIGSTNRRRVPPELAHLLLPPAGAGGSGAAAGGGRTAAGGGGAAWGEAVAGAEVALLAAGGEGPAEAGGGEAAAGGEVAAGSLPPAGVVMHAWDLVKALRGQRGAAAVAASQHQQCQRQHHGSSWEQPQAGNDIDVAGSDISSITGALGSCDACGNAVSCDGGSACGSSSEASTSSSASSSDRSASSARRWQRSRAGRGGSTSSRAGLVRPGEHVAIVGGGLTSAHLAQLALAAGAGHVTLLARGPLRVKQFDVDLVFMGRLRGEALRKFRRLKGWEARLATMRAVLQGGSITPEAAEEVDALAAAGRLSVLPRTTLAGAEWSEEEEEGEGRLVLWNEDGSLELGVHRLWLATGSAVDARAEPLLAGLLEETPLPVHGGLPAVQPTLEWVAGSGLYVLGAYAALQLGPGALNLAGARTGSVLVTDHLWGVAGGEPWLQQLRALQQRHMAACT